MIRFLVPLLPFRFAGLMFSTGWAGWNWWAISLFLGGNRIMLHISPRQINIRHFRQRFPSASDFSRPVIIRYGRVRNA